MRIPHRITSAIALVTFGVWIMADVYGIPAPEQAPIRGQIGAVGWDPCSLVVQWGPMHKLASLVAFGTFLIFAAQGLRNRSSPKLLAIVGALALTLVLEDDWLWISHGCYSAAAVTLLCAWVGAVGVMFLHHCAQHRRAARLRFQDHRLRAFVGQGIVLVFVALFAVYFLARQFVAIVDQRHSETVAAVIAKLDRNIGWALTVLLPFTAFLVLHRTFGNTGSERP